jgi:hypothetical protein
MQGERTEVRVLRLRYSVEGMARLIGLLDHMKLGELPEEIAMFLAHASNAANWHDDVGSAV